MKTKKSIDIATRQGKVLQRCVLRVAEHQPAIPAECDCLLTAGNLWHTVQGSPTGAPNAGCVVDLRLRFSEGGLWARSCVSQPRSLQGRRSSSALGTNVPGRLSARRCLPTGSGRTSRERRLPLRAGCARRLSGRPRYGRFRRATLVRGRRRTGERSGCRPSEPSPGRRRSRSQCKPRLGRAPIPRQRRSEGALET